VEDEQRARAKLTSLGLDGAIANLHPMYLYNMKKDTQQERPQLRVQ
jgi:hypothetical protein